jgi:hypothetical protein
MTSKHKPLSIIDEPAPTKEPVRVPMYVKATYCEGHAPMITLDSDTTLRLPNGKRFGVGAIPVGGKGRKVSMGPEIDGPWAFTFGLCAVIDNNPERRKAERDADLMIDEGTLLRIDAKVYRVRIERREYVNLEAI